MRTRDYGELLIEKLCFRNWLRVLGQTWEKARPDRVNVQAGCSSKHMS